MSEQIEIQSLKKEYPDFFKKAPSELIDFILSEKTAFKIVEICGKNGIEDEEKIREISYRITLVLLEKLIKEKLTITLEGGVGLTPQIAQKISDETDKSIFSLVPLYKTKKAILPKKEIKEELKRPPGKDTYREKIE